MARAPEAMMVFATGSRPMRSTDIAIVGGGLAGSTAAAMLGQAGFNVILIDPHASYPPDFRCEKLDGPQVRILDKTGLTEAVLRVATPDRQSWVARLGRLVEKRPGDQNGIFYDTLVNTIRAEIPKAAEFIHAKATDITPSADRQTITLSTGEAISVALA
jgi:2-polyprenyl-6-methoxyphenol hydroxylase-like FAD-dependent oxidoreductase